MSDPTHQRLSESMHSVTSCTSTIITAATPLSGANHPSIELMTYRVTTPSEVNPPARTGCPTTSVSGARRFGIAVDRVISQTVGMKSSPTPAEDE